MSLTPEIIVSALALLSTGLLGYLQYRSSSKKVSADSTAVEIETFQGLVQEVLSIKRVMMECENKNKITLTYMYELLDFIYRHQHTPPKPPIELATDDNIRAIAERWTHEFPKVT